MPLSQAQNKYVLNLDVMHNDLLPMPLSHAQNKYVLNLDVMHNDILPTS